MKPLHGLFERMTDLDALFAAAHQAQPLDSGATYYYRETLFMFQ